MTRTTAVAVALVFAASIVAGVTGPSRLAAEDAQKPAANAAGTGWSAEVAPDGSSAITLDEYQTKTVEKINGYFNSMKTLQGRFVQTGADGEVMKGEFMMKRPGMFRFNYARPSRQVIISDGTYLAIQDHDLKNEDRVALDQTPFRVLLRSDVDLLRDAHITEVQENDTSLLLALQDKSPDTPGSIRLLLDKSSENLELKEWITTDAQGLDTRVEVGNIERDNEIEASKFVIKAPGSPFPQ
ncbi:MAG: outer membrane lipoprotein carrier protein LolA [Alphaproteobacteria bacterium]|nr:outer membrane lipoprotein carrier protein LolA [Alphaproteobacteria bacterium]